jgi:hypothetical protein
MGFPKLIAARNFPVGTKAERIETSPVTSAICLEAGESTRRSRHHEARAMLSVPAQGRLVEGPVRNAPNKSSE